MGHPTGLARLPLPTCDESVPLSKGVVSHSVAAVPEFRCDPMVDDVPQHVRSPAVFNQPEGVTAELKVVAALINAVGSMAFDIDSAFHVGNELITRSLPWLEFDIGNAHDRNVLPSVGPIRAA